MTAAARKLQKKSAAAPHTRAGRCSGETGGARRFSGNPGVTTWIIALATACFEGLGMLLTFSTADEAHKVPFAVVSLVMVILGLVSTLKFPRWFSMDPLMMGLTNFLCGTGVLLLCTVSPDRGIRQCIFYVAGLVIMVVFSMVVDRVRRFRGLTLVSMVLGIVALTLPLIFGQWVFGAKNWLPVFGGFSIQPSEFVKLSLILSLAYYFSSHRTLLQMLPAILFTGACLLLLMLQRDLGTALIYYLTALIMFFVASGNLLLTALGLGGGVGAALLGYRMFAHVKVRVAMWRNPWSDPMGGGYQIIQALLAIGSGGLYGMGLGQGTPGKIPAYYNDFIFAVACEQMGQVFGIALLLIYVLLFARGISASLNCRHSMNMLLGCGTVAALSIQTLMITAGVIKLIPITGVTMPFLSYGGSSYVTCMAMVGILQGVYAINHREERTAMAEGGNRG